MTAGLEMQYSLISSMFIAVGFALQYITIDIFKQCLQYGDLSGYCEKFDFDLSELFDVETRTLKQAVRRNIHRFPDDFLIALSKEDWKQLITTCDNLPDTVKYSPAPPFAFTEQGVAMLSSVLKSEKAILVNIAIMRAFVFIRQYVAINYLMEKDQKDAEHNNRKRIGFRQDELKH